MSINASSNEIYFLMVGTPPEYRRLVIAEKEIASPESLGRDAGEAKSVGHASMQPNEMDYNEKCNMGGNK